MRINTVHIFIYNFFNSSNSNNNCFFKFLEDTTNCFEILKNTFLYEYIFNSALLLIEPYTYLINWSRMCISSFIYDFVGSNFFKWALIFHLRYLHIFILFFNSFLKTMEPYTILKSLFGQGDYNKYIPNLME